MSISKTKDLPVEMTEEQKEAIVYRSKLLNKYFESYDEMLKAEEDFKKTNEEKIKKAEEKKARAAEIQKAKDYVIEVRKQAAKMIKDADDAYEQLRLQFIKDYGYYHESSCETDGNVVTVGDILETFFSW